ncbi:MAG: alpha/beta fold hydrolase [Pyrinomonadaceae bacterium]
MENTYPKVYRFDRFRIDPRERLLFKEGEAIYLAPKVFDTLLYLVENRGKLLLKDVLLNEVWNGNFVEENNLAQNISQLRKVLGETRDRHFIETVPTKGYRFVCNVLVEDNAQTISAPEPAAEPDPIHSSDQGFHPPNTRYVRNGDVNIAYQVLGDGPIDIVFVMGWVSHLEYFWKHELFADFLRSLAGFSRLILFDKRGTGLSDRVPESRLPTLEERMDDVRAVMDAVGSEKAVLFGVSEGGPMCGLFGATYPQRTLGLMMFGTYARRLQCEGFPHGITEDELNRFLNEMLENWGTPIGLETRAPSMMNDERFRDWWAEYLRMGVSPGAAVALSRMNSEIDVRGVLPTIRVPALVMHREGDICLGLEEGRFVAQQIPNSRFVELVGDDHLPFLGDSETVVALVRDFVSELDRSANLKTGLLSVVCVKSEKSADSSAIKLALEEYGYHQPLYGISEKDGQVYAGFDGPVKAINCAFSIRDDLRKRLIEISAGIHTGECELASSGFGGFPLELGGLVAEKAPAGVVATSRTVKDLVAGSGLKFEEFGEVTDKSFGDSWRVYEVTGRT